MAEFHVGDRVIVRREHADSREVGSVATVVAVYRNHDQVSLKWDDESIHGTNFNPSVGMAYDIDEIQHWVPDLADQGAVEQWLRT